MHREVGRFSYRLSNSYFLQETSPTQSSETGSRASTSREQSLVDILKAGSQGGVQDFLPLTIDTRGAYQDNESDEGLPPAKRSCYREEDKDDEENEEGDQTFEVFDPANYFQSEQNYDPPEKITSYVSQNFQRCLNKATRRTLAREHPQPSIPAVTPPLADDVLVDFLGSKFPKRTDDTLRSIQAAVLAGTIPLINLWSDMLRSGSLDQEEPTLNAGDVLLAIQKALVLSGNAASYISRIRRDQILMHFDPNLIVFSEWPSRQAWCRGSTRKGGTWKPPKLIQDSKRKLAQSQKFGHSQKGKNRYFRRPQQDH